MSGDVRGFLIERIAARCGLTADEVDPDRPLEEFGLSSRDAVGIAGELAGLLGRDLAPTLVWEHPTIARLAAALGSPSPEPVAGPFAAAGDDDAIAVVGLGCRVPGAHGPEEFWRLLMEGRDAVTTVPEGRWEPFAGLEATRHGGFLDDVAGFDAEFFGISPGEAETMDPQQRLLLETAWEALEHGGLAPRSLRGSRTGVFVGISGNEYAYLTTADPAGIDAWTATGAALSIAANRLSYLLDLRGPSLALDTACSSSLVAVHLAVRSLRSGECDLAVAGGVNLLLSPVVTRAFDQGGGTSPDGRCKAFDASADGMVRAEGCGVVVLKRLADADGDRVLAVIRATGVNQDGRSNGLVAPNPEAQQALLASVYGGLDRGPDYIECHGTGTFLGDPIEGRAIAASVDGRVLIGSVKSNLGHLEAAAGVTGVIKTVLSLWHGVIPASIHFATPNPHLPWERLEVVTQPTPWPREDARAGVSSFGFGGTNAHVVLDACPPPRADAGWEARPPAPLLDAGTPTARRLFVLSDASAERVREHAALLAAWRPAADPADIAHTLARRAHRGRIAAAAFDLADLPAATPAPVRPATRPPVWVFSGYGSQWPGMGAHLHRTEPAFRACLDELAPLLRAEAGIDLWSEPEGVATAQPLIFAVQLALARLWQAYGMHPGAVIGHSMGEVAAAVVAGGLGVHDGVRVICRRARRLASLGGGGAMAVADVPAAQVPGSQHVAVYASRTRTVVTGAPDEIARFAEQLAAREVFCRVLTTEGAGHSPQVQPLLPLLRSDLAALTPAKATVPFYSTVFDDPREAPTFEAAYWAAGIRRPVRLTQALRAAADDGFTLFTEVSPHPMLGLDFCSTRRDSDESFYTQLALAAASSPPRTRGRVVDVPHAPWRHTRHWADRVRRPTGHPVLGVHVETPSGHAWSVELSEGTHLSLAQVAELAGAAASELGTTAGRVRLHAPLALPARVTVTVGEDLVEVSRKDAAGMWRRHGSAVLGSGDAAADETAGMMLPVPFAAKLVQRAWVPVPPGPVSGGERLVLPEDLDALGA
ncbi:MAG: acyltransferase domain-containing protein, partial [Thermoactinospora sp.]|nr:acyltransferase domain-containing protein [Thermoactinospora sp.]